jgi:hypothetical protein
MALAEFQRTGGGNQLVSEVYGMPIAPMREFRDLIGNNKVAQFENIYDADFEYGEQPGRWEKLLVGGGTVVHVPQQGGVRLAVTTANGDIAIRQSRPYHRYQPGKTMSMSSNVVMDPAVVNNRQRLGFFDDSNGCFFEQADPDFVLDPATNQARNPSGMHVVIRSDVSGTVVDTRIPMHQWNGDKEVIREINWSNKQMVKIEYTWYGGGSIQFGVMLRGRPYILHQEDHGNKQGTITPWCRTGNLPVRYETRNIGATTQASNMLHWGVSVGIWGGANKQRGSNYTYGMALGQPTRTVAAGTTRFPILSIRMRPMGTIEYTQANAACTAGTTTSLTAGTAAWTVNQWQGRHVNYFVAGVSYIARIVSNTATVLTIADNISGAPVTVAPVAGQNYTIGLVNRGQLLPERLVISSTALAQCEVFFSTGTSPITLTAANFVAMSTLGATNSFAERDVSATSFTGGERVKKFLLPAGGSGIEQFSLESLFPLYNNIRGNLPDVMTLAITTQSGVPSSVGADFDAQEAMS